MTVGERIRNRRIELGLSQDELAKKMGYKNKSAICRVERDYEQNLTLDRVSLFANALDCTEQYLMGWEQNKPKLTGKLALEHIALISKYDKLSDDNKVLVNNLIDSLISNDVGQE